METEFFEFLQGKKTGTRIQQLPLGYKMAPKKKAREKSLVARTKQTHIPVFFVTTRTIRPLFAVAAVKLCIHSKNCLVDNIRKRKKWNVEGFMVSQRFNRWVTLCPPERYII